MRTVLLTCGLESDGYAGNWRPTRRTRIGEVSIEVHDVPDDVTDRQVSSAADQCGIVHAASVSYAQLTPGSIILGGRDAPRSA